MHTNNPVRIYADAHLRDSWAYTPLLYPFWGAQLKDTTPYLSLAYGAHGWDPAYFTLVSRPQDAEYIVLPHDYWWMKAKRPDLLRAYTELSETHHVPLLVDALSDSGGRVLLPNARILRTNQYRFLLPADEITTPYAVEDLLESYCGGTLEPRPKTSRPSIGFAGFARLSAVQRLRAIVKELPIRIRGIFDRRYQAMQRGVFWRERAMRAFARSQSVQCDFLVRPSYSGHVKTVAGDMKRNRQEFVNNLLNNDYALVVRGDPNASQRFYEALSLGRIPVLIDTESVLPLEHLIDYSECCVIIAHRDISRAPAILADFHARVSPETFIRMQERARYVYEHYLRIDSFSKYLAEQLREKK